MAIEGTESTLGHDSVDDIAHLPDPSIRIVHPIAHSGRIPFDLLHPVEILQEPT